MSKLQNALEKLEEAKKKSIETPEAVEHLSEEQLDDIAGGWNGVGCKETNYSCR